MSNTNYEEILAWLKEQDLNDTEKQLLEVNEKLYRHKLENVSNCGKDGIHNMYILHCFTRGLKYFLLDKQWKY